MLRTSLTPLPFADPADSTGSLFDAAVGAHDRLMSELGLAVWIGNEPTFTDRRSQLPEWTVAALGGEKRARAERLISSLAVSEAGAVLLRCFGRKYPGEDRARWSLGLYSRRDGEPIWNGPPDPMLVEGSLARADEELSSQLQSFHFELEAVLLRAGAACRAFAGPSDRRLVFALDPQILLPDETLDTRLRRSSIHEGNHGHGPEDDLAAAGMSLLIVSAEFERDGRVPCLELPKLTSVDAFSRLLEAVALAARAASLDCLILRGFSPPVTSAVRWTTATPDPAVVEMNMAPHATLAEFLAHNRACYAAAARAGLEPYRLFYNGAVGDSGGAGQITFGGPSAEQSPFFLVPELLPRFVRYGIEHPSLSYLFAHDYVGGSGQSVRADEHGVDALADLRLSLELLACESAPPPATIWSSLSPCLTDTSGNSHRSEINIEKLWNPFQPERGQLGLVEFRAFRMQHTPERAAALAALLRTILARLMTRPYTADLVDWGRTLHDRFSLPFYLKQDLRAVLADLAAHGMALPDAFIAELELDPLRDYAVCEFSGCTVTVRHATEFWPLIGDVTNQQGTSRLVDSSTARLELTLRMTDPDRAAELAEWKLRAENIELPLRAEADPSGPVRVFGLRYRRFAPNPGLFPTLLAQDPLHLSLHHPTAPEALAIELYEWRPDGAAYPDLPADLADASARRAARCVTRTMPVSELPAETAAPRSAFSDYALDLRYLPTLRGTQP